MACASRKRPWRWTWPQPYRALARQGWILIAGDSTNGLIETHGLAQPHRRSPVTSPRIKPLRCFNAAALRRWPQLLPALTVSPARISECGMWRRNGMPPLDGEGKRWLLSGAALPPGQGVTTAGHKKDPARAGAEG